jgi:SAM-dependent methyltransferase
MSPDDRSIGEYLVSTRSFAEYQAMFALTDADLAGRLLDCPGGGAGFTAAVCERGGSAVAADPVYATPAPELIRRLDDELRRGSAWAAAHAERYDWDFYGGPAEHGRMREESARVFGADLLRHPDRYVTAALPDLPFSENSFDLVLSSHLLFTYADRLDPAFHVAALRELARVSRGRVRVFPLVDQAGRPLPGLLEHVLQELTADGLLPRVVDVDYAFQRGSGAMLELRVTR